MALVTSSFIDLLTLWIGIALMPIRIRLSILMPIQIRILIISKVLHFTGTPLHIPTVVDVLAWSSVADPDPGSWFLPIPDPGSRIQKQEQKRGVKKNCCYTFFGSHKFHKIVNYFIFELLKEKIWANFQRIIELFTQKTVTKLSKIWVWDPGPGVKEAPDPGSATLAWGTRVPHI